ncbi:MAG: hypothetical protein JNK02_11160 [Planctomycetes bacterium]|nr:hypothetical protein [Planctomycetota bacterium]
MGTTLASPAASDHALTLRFAMPHPIRPAVLLSVLAACLPVVAGTAAVPQQASTEAELGYLGFQPPEVTDIRVDEVLLHEDTSGGVLQALHGLAAARGGGFALIWRDQRDGMLSFYWARLDANGALREPERPVAAVPGTTRRFDPAVAIAPDGSGGVAWVSRHGGQQRPWLRTFDAEGAFYGTDRAVEVSEPPPEKPSGGPGAGRGGAAARGRDAAPAPRSPVMLARADGSRTLLWSEGTRLRAASFDVAGGPLRLPWDLATASGEVEVGLRAVEDAQGGLGLLWTASGSVSFARPDPQGGKAVSQSLGAGRARTLLADPAGGFVALLVRGEAAVLRRIGADGKLGAESVWSAPGLRDADLAAAPGGLALLVTVGAPPPRAGRDGARADPPAPRDGGRGAAGADLGPARLELVLLDAAFAPTEPPIPITTGAAREVGGAHLGSNGERLLAAWNDARQGDADIFARVFDAARTGDERLGPEQRVNTDFASSDQIKPDVDALGDRGLAVWQDRRDGPGAIYARRFDLAGPQGPELVLPRPVGGAERAIPAGGAMEPAVALRPDGSALVAWVQRDGGRSRVLGQVLDATGGARSPLLEIDAREGASHERAAVARLAGERGWIVVWPAGGDLGIHARRVAPDGAFPGPARRVNEGDDTTRHADVALLDDGRLVAGWSVHKRGAPEDKHWSVRARFLDAEGTPKGGELAFEPSRRNEDHDPVFAPAKGGGFLMAWCSGLPGDPTHDVNVRLFDAQGRPAGPNLTPCFLANEQDLPDVTRLADGSFAVVWEDDVSYFDHVYVRRIAADGRSMGPWMRVNKLDTKFIADRVEPRITALGDGWAAVYADRQRSQGFDTRLKIVGPRFDAPGGG